MPMPVMKNIIRMVRNFAVIPAACWCMSCCFIRCLFSDFAYRAAPCRVKQTKTVLIFDERLIHAFGQRASARHPQTIRLKGTVKVMGVRASGPAGLQGAAPLGLACLWINHNFQGYKPQP
jgi:hypothetical protein